MIFDGEMHPVISTLWPFNSPSPTNEYYFIRNSVSDHVRVRAAYIKNGKHRLFVLGNRYNRPRYGYGRYIEEIV